MRKILLLTILLSCLFFNSCGASISDWRADCGPYVEYSKEEKCSSENKEKWDIIEYNLYNYIISGKYSSEKVDMKNIFRNPNYFNDIYLPELSFQEFKKETDSWRLDEIETYLDKVEFFLTLEKYVIGMDFNKFVLERGPYDKMADLGDLKIYSWVSSKSKNYTSPNKYTVSQRKSLIGDKDIIDIYEKKNEKTITVETQESIFVNSENKIVKIIFEDKII